MPTNLEFRGRWLNVYGNLILIAFLTGITLCIYVPWGYARWQRIVTENTYYEDQQLEFDGSGVEVFVQFIVIGILHADYPRVIRYSRFRRDQDAALAIRPHTHAQRPAHGV